MEWQARILDARRGHVCGNSILNCMKVCQDVIVCLCPWQDRQNGREGVASACTFMHKNRTIF